MARHGFIHDKLDIKFLILYIMARVASPIDFHALTDLTMCDDGVDYFEFAEAVSELVETGHLTLENDLYAITDKGRSNGAACESSLPYTVKQKCGVNLARIRHPPAQRPGARPCGGPAGGGQHGEDGAGRRQGQPVYAGAVLRYPGAGPADGQGLQGGAGAGV